MICEKSYNSSHKSDDRSRKGKLGYCDLQIYGWPGPAFGLGHKKLFSREGRFHDLAQSPSLGSNAILFGLASQPPPRKSPLSPHCSDPASTSYPPRSE